MAASVTCYVVTVHTPLLGLQFTHELLHVTIYMGTIYIRSFHVSIATVLVFFQMYVPFQLYDQLICISMDINTECFGKPVLTHSCVWIIAGLVVITQLYSTHFDIGTVSSVFMNLCFNEFAEPSTRT